jgi:acyl-CoA dehydrogenase
VAARMAKVVVQPFGRKRLGPSDELVRRCAEILLQPSEARDRLTAGIFPGADDDAVAQLERAFDLTIETEPVRRKLRQLKLDTIEDGLRHGVLSAREADRLRAAETAVSEVVAVDHFEPWEVSPLAAKESDQWQEQRTKGPATAK